MTLREADGIDPVAILTSRGWLSRRPPPFRDAMLAQAVEQRRAAGEPLFHSGDEAGGLFGVIRGVIEIATRFSGEDVHIVHLGRRARGSESRRRSLVRHASSALSRAPICASPMLPPPRSTPSPPRSPTTGAILLR